MDPAIIGLQEIVKNKKEINEGKTYSHFEKFTERAKQVSADADGTLATVLHVRDGHVTW